MNDYCEHRTIQPAPFEGNIPTRTIQQAVREYKQRKEKLKNTLTDMQLAINQKMDELPELVEMMTRLKSCDHECDYAISQDSFPLIINKHCKKCGEFYK